MFITKITLSEEDKQSILELQHKCNELFLPIEKIRSENMTPEQVQQANEAYFKVSRQLYDLREDIRRRYIAELSKDKAQALQNASEILDAYTIEDYRAEAREARTRALERIEEIKALLDDVPAYKESPDVQKEYNYWKIVRDTSGFNFTGAYHRLSTITVYEREALLLGEHGEKELDDLIYKKASSFYKPRGKEVKQPEPETPPIGKDGNYVLDEFTFRPEYMAYYGGPITNTMAAVTTKGIMPNKAGDIVVSKEVGRSKYTYTLTADGAQGVISGLNPSSQKLFVELQEQFSMQNHYRPNGDRKLNTLVHMSLKDFARMRGENIDEEPKDVMEDVIKERQRAKDVLDNFRKKTKRDLDTIYRLSVEGEEPGKNKKQQPDFFKMRLVDSVGIRKGEIVVNFTLPFASYLVNSYVIKAPRSIHKLPDKNPNCLAIALKLSSHSSNDNNKIKKTDNIISVKSLLEAAPQIQSYDQLLASGNRNWKRCIREPLEAALELNVDFDVINEWYYCGSKGVRISDAALEATSYHDYEGLYVAFKMKNPPDDSERLSRKAEAKAQAKAKKKAPKKR